MTRNRPIFGRHSSRCDGLSMRKVTASRPQSSRLSRCLILQENSVISASSTEKPYKMRRRYMICGFSRSVPLICGLFLLLASVGCQHQQASTPLSRRHELLQLRAQSSNGAADKSQENPVVSAEFHGTDGKMAANSGSRWTGWLDHLPRPPRIPLPRTDMGGSDIAVLDPGMESASAGNY